MNDNDDTAPPLPATLAAEFPVGDDLNLLMGMREEVRKIGRAMGLREVGCGVGVGGADVQFALGERDLIVTIEISDKR